MAERRMFAKSIVLSDAFLDMPMSARCLYFTLGMLADDDGFVGNPKSIMRQCGSTTDDMNILLAKRYVLGFDSGIIVIKHWRMNNYLRNDRYTETTYREEKDTLTLDDKGSYTEKNKSGIPSGYQVDTQYRIGKESIGKDNNKTRFTRPSIQEIKDYCAERKNNVNAEQFFDFYEANGWVQGKGKPIKDWKACVRTWERKESTQTKRSDIIPEYNEAVNPDYDEDRFNEIMRRRNETV